MGAQAAGGHEMSVPKSRRGESPAEYINLAREIYVFTYNRVRILPKSYTFYFSLPLYNAAREAYRLIKTANLIYIHNDADKQNRKELYERAQGYISASRTTILLGIAAHPAHTFTRDAGMKTVSALKSDRISWTNLRRVPQRPQIGISRRRSWTTLLYSHKC